jgi:hypothetical protein
MPANTHTTLNTKLLQQLAELEEEGRAAAAAVSTHIAHILALQHCLNTDCYCCCQYCVFCCARIACLAAVLRQFTLLLALSECFTSALLLAALLCHTMSYVDHCYEPQHTATVLHTALLQQAAVARAGGVSPPRLHRRVSPPNIPPIVGRGTAPGTVSGTIPGTVSGTVLPGPPPRHSAPAPPSILPRPVSDHVIGSDTAAATTGATAAGTAAGAAAAGTAAGAAAAAASSSGLGRRYSDNTAATGGAAAGGIRSSVIMSDVQSVSSAGPEPSHRASIISTLSGVSGMSSADARSSVMSTTSGATEAVSEAGGAATVTTTATTSTATGGATGGATTSSSSTASASVRGYTTLREGGGLGALNGTGSATGQSELQELRGLDLPINTFSCTVGLKLSQVRCSSK